MDNSNKIIKTLARWKIYIDRARWYIVLVQFFMITFVFIKTAGWNLAWWHYPIVVAGVMFLFLVAGYADRKLGLIKEEQRFYSTENPVIQEILKEARK